jgi:predicted dehydrogenase
MFAGRVATTVEELLEDPTIDAVSDCSSNETHHIFSTKSLKHGKHVLCEKPIALTVAQAKTMIEAQKDTGKQLMIAHNQRFTEAHRKAKEIIQSNVLGKVLTFQTTFGHGGPEGWGINKSNSTWFFKKERSGLGVTGDLGIHKIDLVHFLLNDEISQVSAFHGALNKVDENGDSIEVADNIVASLKTRKGYLGTASFSWTYYGEEDNSTIIYCEKGILKIYHNKDKPLEVITKDGEERIFQSGTFHTNPKRTNSGVVDAFIESIQHNRTPPVTGEEALLSLKVVLAMVQAAETESVVSVK